MDKNYVSVGNIIEQERLRRQSQISKSIINEVYDHIEKAHNDDLNYNIEKSDNLTRFETDIQDLNKAETELLLHKIQRQLNADSESMLLKAMKSIAINHANDLEKATYVDNSQNRKLGRVGQAYGGKKEVESMVNSEGMLNKKHPDAKRFTELDKKFDDKITRKQMSDKELLEYDTLHRKFLSARKEWNDKRNSDSKKKIGGAPKSMSLSDAVNKFLTEKENADYNEAISWGDDDDVKELEQLAIKRAKKKGIAINNYNGIEKAGHGIYEDNAENRRLNRVGQEYGHAAEQKYPANKQPKKQEEGGGIQSHAAKASDEALKRAAADEKADKSVREAAKAELAKRNGGKIDEGRVDFSNRDFSKMSDEEMKKNIDDFNSEDTHDKNGEKIQHPNDYYHYHRALINEYENRKKKDKFNVRNKKQEDFGFDQKRKEDDDYGLIGVLKRIDDAISPWGGGSREIDKFVRDYKKYNPAKNLVKYIAENGFTAENSKLEGVEKERFDALVDELSSKVSKKEGSSLMGKLMEAWELDANHKFGEREKWEGELVKTLNKIGKDAKWFNRNAEVIANANTGEYDDKVEKLFDKVDGIDELFDLVSEIGDDTENPPSSGGEGDEVVDSSNIGENIISALKADQGALDNTRRGKRAQSKIVRAAEDFIKRNPNTKITQDDLLDIVGGDVDYVEEKFGKLRGWKKLNDAIESYLDAE